MTTGAEADDPSARLRELSAATARSIASLTSSFESIVEATADVATDDEHDPEGNTIAWERQQIAGLLDQARITMTDIEAAEQRFEDGLYGACESCGLEIAAARLEALPATPRCVNCAS